MTPTREQIQEAKEWFDGMMRGKTVYDGHPIQVIGELMDQRLTPPEPEAQDALELVNLEIHHITNKQTLMLSALKTGEAKEREIYNGVQHLTDRKNILKYIRAALLHPIREKKLREALRDISNAPDADCFEQMKSIATQALLETE